jgi:hypothetical protein
MVELVLISTIRLNYHLGLKLLSFSYIVLGNASFSIHSLLKRSTGKSNYMAQKKKKVTHYVDNVKFYTALIQYKALCEKAEKKNQEKPQVPEYIAVCFMDIAKHLATKPQFRNYGFIDDMIYDGVENCIRYVSTFNPDTSNNPFAYFTKAIWYAFLRRIEKEKKWLYTKYKAINNSEVFSLLHEKSEQTDIDITHDIGYSESARDNMNQFIFDYETKQESNKKKKKEKEVAKTKNDE